MNAHLPEDEHHIDFIDIDKKYQDGKTFFEKCLFGEDVEKL